MSTTQKEPVRQIVYSAAQCLVCTKLIESTNRHDYKTCGCPQQTMIDGGLDYLRWGGRDLKMVRLITKYADDPFEDVRKFAFRIASLGPNKGKPIRLYKMSNEWIDNAIQDHVDRQYGAKWHILLLIKEKQYRIENEIFIDEEDTIKEDAETLKARLSPKKELTALEKEEESIRLPAGQYPYGKR